MEGKFGGAIAGLVLLAGVIWWSQYRSGEDSWDIHDEMVEVLSDLPDMDTHGSLYMGWFETHHDAVFEDHYQAGHKTGRRGRYQRAEFDGAGYLHALLTAMIGDAVGAGYEAQAEHLRELREAVYWEE